MSAPDPLLGRVLADRYRLTVRLGAGASGVVYRAEDLALGGIVAVKVLRSDGPLTGDQRARFEREAQVLHRLSHPAVVGFVDYGHDDIGPFIVQELVEGVDLRSVLRAGRVFAPALAARLVGEVLGALGAAHAAGLVHRDVKPGNVMIVEDVEGALGVRLLDFGCVRPFLPPRGTGMFRTRVGLPAGTPAYAAPEQRAGEAVGPAADQFAAALLWVELVVGRRAFRGLVEGLRAGQLDALPPRVSSAARAVVARAIAAAPEDRFASADAMRQALERATAEEEPSPAAPATWTAPAELVTDIRRVRALALAERPPRLGRAAFFAAGVVVGAALAIALWPARAPTVIVAGGTLGAAPPTIVASPPPTVVPPIMVLDRGVERALDADGGAAPARSAAPVSPRPPRLAAAAPAPRSDAGLAPAARRARPAAVDDARPSRAPTSAAPERPAAPRRADPPPAADEIHRAPPDAGPPPAAPARADAGRPDVRPAAAGPPPDQVFAEALGRCDCAAARRALDALEEVGAAAARLPRERYRRACLVLGVGCRRAGAGRPR